MRIYNSFIFTFVHIRQVCHRELWQFSIPCTYLSCNIRSLSTRKCMKIEVKRPSRRTTKKRVNSKSKSRKIIAVSLSDSLSNYVFNHFWKFISILRCSVITWKFGDFPFKGRLSLMSYNVYVSTSGLRRERNRDQS